MTSKPRDMESADSDREESDSSSVANSSSMNATSEMSEQEEAEDLLIVVVDLNKQWTTMEDRAGSTIALFANQLRDHPLFATVLVEPREQLSRRRELHRVSPLALCFQRMSLDLRKNAVPA